MEANTALQGDGRVAEAETLIRPTSAPPQLAIDASEDITPDDPRLTPAYYAYYYSQRPLDPRLPPPLYDSSRWRFQEGSASSLLQHPKPINVKSDVLPSLSGTWGSAVGSTSRSSVDSATESIKSPLEMIQSDFPRTSSPIYLSKSTKEKSFQAPAAPVLPSIVGRSSPALTTSVSPILFSKDRRYSVDFIETSSAGSSSGSRFTNGSDSSSLEVDSSLTDREAGIFKSPFKASVDQPSFSTFSSKSSDILPGLQGLTLNDEEYTGAIRDENFPGDYGDGEIYDPYVQPDDVPLSPFGSAYRSPVSPMMAVMGFGTGVTTSKEPTSPQRVVGGFVPRDGASQPEFTQFVPRSPYAPSQSWDPMAGRKMYPEAQFAAVDSRGAAATRGSGYAFRGGYRGGKGRKFSAGPQSSPAEFTPAAPRHALLQELRLSKGGASIRLDDVVSKGLVSEFATDQNGSRFIQQALETATAEQKESVFEQLEPETLRLCVDVFGNYVIQKFFEFGLPSHRRTLANKLVGNVLPLSLQMYGCRVIQKALEVIGEDQQVLLIKELEGHVIKCVKDQNGNHVIQKCIEKVPSKHIEFLVDAFKGQVFNLSTHAYGCRVIQRLLEYCHDDQKVPIFEEILDRVLDLVTDQYGNYVIQHVLQRGASVYRTEIIKLIENHVLDMSKHKFASNVIEKCFAYAAAEEKTSLVNKLIGDDNVCPLAEMVKDQYANYVVQKVLGVVSEDDQARIIETVRVRVPNLRKITYGKHIVARVEKLTGRTL